MPLNSHYHPQSPQSLDCVPVGVNPCSDLVCGPGEHCNVDPASFTAHCSCPSICPQLLRPVCGSDGLTYDSDCHLRRSACLERLNVTVRHHGSCGILYFFIMYCIIIIVVVIINIVIVVVIVTHLLIINSHLVTNRLQSLALLQL